MRRIRIAAMAVMLTAGVSLGSASVASAAKPANKACVGESLSALAMSQMSPGAFGAGAAGLAQDPSGRPGLGDFVQAGQAGLIPDEVLPNTCND